MRLVSLDPRCPQLAERWTVWAGVHCCCVDWTVWQARSCSSARSNPSACRAASTQSAAATSFCGLWTQTGQCAQIAFTAEPHRNPTFVQLRGGAAGSAGAAGRTAATPGPGQPGRREHPLDTVKLLRPSGNLSLVSLSS